jgi:hypothetical protein
MELPGTRLHAMMDIYGLFWGSTGA